MPSNLLLGLLWLTGCQEPFDRDRHDLVGLRVAAVTAQVSDGQVQPRIALVVDGRPWSRAEATVDWFWIDAPGDSVDRVAGGLGVGFGPAPTIELPDDIDADASDSTSSARLAVVVELDGQVERAELDVAGPNATQRRFPFGIQTGTVAMDVQSVEGSQMALDARRDLDLTPARSVAPGGFARFAGTTGAMSDDSDLRTRFMATRYAASGRFFELDATTTDWVAGDLVLDDEDVEEREVGSQGPLTVLGLAIGDGRSGLGVADFFVGDVPDGLWTEGRFVPTPDVPTGEVVRGRLAAADDSPIGLELVDVREETPSDPPFDAAVLPCVGVAGPSFDPNWLLDHRCIREDLVGTEVRIVVDAP